MAATGIFRLSARSFCWPSRARSIIGGNLKFAGYVHHYKILTGNIFGLILKNQMAATVVSLSIMKSVYISLIIGPKGLVCKANVYEIMGWESCQMWSDLTLGPSFKVKGYPNLKVLMTHLLLVLEVCHVKSTCIKSWAGNLLMWSELTLSPSKLK